MPERSARELTESYTNAINTRDWETLASVLHPDFYNDYPQSGERIRGVANFRATFEDYPGGLPSEGLEKATVIGPEDRWVVAPNFSMIRVSGTADVFTTVVRTRHPDGTEWFVISLIRAEQGRMHSATTYFAPYFPAPEWRARFAERIPDWTPLATPRE